VRFFPTDICNFNCSYCFPGSHDEKYRYPKNINTIIKNFRILFDLYKSKLNKTKIHLIISGGGEPTVWPHIEQFCKEIKEKHDVYITIVSNGSRTLRWWEENSLYFDAVNLSCHHEFVNIDHYVDVADSLYNKGVKVTSLMLMDAQYWDKCVSYIERMKKSRYHWLIQTKEIVDALGHGIDVYTQEQILYINSSLKRIPDAEWLLKNINDLNPFESVVLFNDDTAFAAKSHSIIVNKWNNFYGWECNVALETLVISPDGSAKGSCQEPVFGKTVPNLFSETFEQDFDINVDFKSIICPRVSCDCQPETHVTKSKTI
jgi:MoaA/NifB/PqqE/SkfB family radical SAM enzyme